MSNKLRGAKKIYKKVKLKCPVCNKVFIRFPSVIKKHKHHYCSHKCYGQGIILGITKRKKNGILKKCLICNKKIYVTPYQTKTGRGKYCSRKCFE